MADLILIATSVVADSSDAQTITGIAGATIAAGQPVYKNPSTGLYEKAGATSASLANCAGIALNGAAINQSVTIQYKGSITIGATVAIGTIYVLSATAGGIAPSADLATTNFVTVLGIATTAAKIKLALNVSSIAKP